MERTRMGLEEGREAKWVGTERTLEVQSSREGDEMFEPCSSSSSMMVGGGPGTRTGREDSEGSETRRPVHLGTVDVKEEEGRGGRKRFVSR